ncbi:alpha/beta hydrolase-fold protein [Rhodanobacter sp. MP7CTX1]|uniref:alpha/beta hydrolase n=1 Tax=Rhodanobacter sp. MP7CTX1 TaxID=2723084 RepID=UPI001609EEBF|nr:alpha/beta hydrolase-fold protein [Rhodanobacter sp. MP7CTX1]MBB6186282.1 enterochelin esterase-like enzyme [Rhodanobacter sp. MP7CTX1]
MARAILIPLLSACVLVGYPSDGRSVEALHATPALMDATGSDAASATTSVVRLQLAAKAFAPEQIKVAIYLPPGYEQAAATGRRFPVLYANDGQDMPAVGLQSTLVQLYRDKAIEPVIVVAIDMLSDRASAYGLSDRATSRSIVGGSRIGPIGTRAQDYSAWVATQLLPYVDMHYRTQRSAKARTILGWSLGALNAFNLAWQYPDLFGRVGAFSPSFWLASDRTNADTIQKTRLAQDVVDRSSKRVGLKLWFSVGTAEETSDRNGDGVIDAIEDVQDLIEGYRAADGFQTRGLKQLGYSIDPDYAQHPSAHIDVALLLLKDGEHNQASWKKMLPPFLLWAYGRH